MKRKSIALLVSTLAAAIAMSLVPADASALGFDVNLKLKAGYETAPSGATEADGAFAYGAEAAGLIGLIPMVDLTFGPYFSANFANHTLSDGQADAGLNVFAVGGKVRFEMGAVVEVHGGYAFGDQSVEADGVSLSEADLTGYQFGAFVGYGISLVPALLQLEIGPYFDYYGLKGEDAPEDAETSTFSNVGLAVQGNFGF